MQFKRKLMNQTCENGKKLSFKPNFGPFGPNFSPPKSFSWILPLQDVRHCCNLSLYHISGKVMNQIWENGKKLNLAPDFGSFGPNSSRQNFFFKNLTLSVTRYHGQLSSCTTSEKNNDPILRKLSEGQPDAQMDKQTVKSDFIGRCPTNVKCPIIIIIIIIIVIIIIIIKWFGNLETIHVSELDPK